MSKGMVLLALASLAMLAGATVANAGPPTEQEVQARLRKPDYARGGYFFGAEGFYAVENSSQIAGTNVYIGSGGLRLRVGHRNNRWWGSEIQGQFVNTFTGESESFLAWGMGVNGRVYFSKSRFQPFVMFGPGFTQLRVKDEGGELPPGADPVSAGNTIGFTAHFGAGAEIYWTETLAITLQASYYLTVANIENYDFMTFGLGLQFF